tara:strand:+ start:1103 stop:2119 length:1017 start_codon:yes stop_codon:yes gene_type:complete
MMIQEIVDNLKDHNIEIDSAQIDLVNKMSAALNKEHDKSNKKGFYVWGDVGRGKTLVMKSFFDTLKVSKISFHYIDFMQNVHNELTKVTNKKNPLDLIAKTLSKKYKIIFIDEFQVEDITDAMIIGNLLNYLIKLNVTLYLTSNAHPDDLYKNGLQRQVFIKNMKIMQESLNIYKLNGLIDYRARNIINSHIENPNMVYGDKNIISLLEDNFIYKINKENKFKINSKYFSCKAFSNDFLWISFIEFFKEPNGAKDYIEISKNIEWIFLSDFKRCNDDSSDIVRRFISFIDICYKDKTKIKFFENESVLKDLYTGEKLEVLWNRCCSRLHEMQTSDYLI